METFGGGILGSYAWKKREAETWALQLPLEKLRAEALAPSKIYSKEATDARDGQGDNDLVSPTVLFVQSSY